jgi:hypothetical protein
MARTAAKTGTKSRANSRLDSKRINTLCTATTSTNCIRVANGGNPQPGSRFFPDPPRTTPGIGWWWLGLMAATQPMDHLSLILTRQHNYLHFPLFDHQPVRSAYQPPASSTFLSEWISHQQPAVTSQQYSSLRTNQHQPSATSQPNRELRVHAGGRCSALRTWLKILLRIRVGADVQSLLCSVVSILLHSQRREDQQMSFISFGLAWQVKQKDRNKTLLVDCCCISRHMVVGSENFRI